MKHMHQFHNFLFVSYAGLYFKTLTHSKHLKSSQVAHSYRDMCVNAETQVKTEIVLQLEHGSALCRWNVAVLFVMGKCLAHKPLYTRTTFC